MKLNQTSIFPSVLILALHLSAAQALASMVAPADLPDLVEKVMPGVVNISSTTIVGSEVQGMDDFLRFWGVPQERKQTSLGSGLIIDKEGYVITNNHVVAHATEVMVTLLDKRQLPAKLIGKDPKTDLALLKIVQPGKLVSSVPNDLKPLTLADSDKVRIAESVFAVGNPFGLSHTVTIGIISAKNRTIGMGPFDNFLQTDAAINPGNSGGPLFNLKGEVVGINTVIFSRAQQNAGVGFAIPITEVKRILPDLKKHGRVLRPWLGLLGEQMNTARALYYNLATDKGVLVYNLVRSGPADKAGLKQGDIIIAMDGETTLDLTDLERELYKKTISGTSDLTVMRGKRRLALKVKLAELPSRVENLEQGIL